MTLGACHRFWLALGSVVVIGASGVQASAQSPPVFVKQAEAAIAKAKTHYNSGGYEAAAGLYLRAAQIDPGAKHLAGTPYRNLARCMFWLERYDRAVFWYDIYRSGWPSAKDADRVFEERQTANARRANPTKTVTADVIYDRSVLELVDTLRQRVSAGGDALTSDGGGTLRLYTLAIDRQYALPDLATIGARLRQQLMKETEARWQLPVTEPTPQIGAASESLDTVSARIDAARTLGPTDEEARRLDSYSRLVAGLRELDREAYIDAASSLNDAQGALPDLHFISYLAAVAYIRGGEPAKAAELLSRRQVEGGPLLYWQLLSANAQAASGDHKRAAAGYLTLIRGIEAPTGTK